MALDPKLSEALAILTEARSLYWQRDRDTPWTRDESLERALADAWAAVTAKVDQQELVVPVSGPPQCNVGAPTPVLVAGVEGTSVAYDRQDSERCLLTFRNVDSVLFGGSNDEALNGHRLWGRGLEPYAFQEVINSAWIAQRERENSVHDYHRGGWHARLRHFIYTFHDETFECIAADFVVDDRDNASPTAMAALSM
ncbi:hypothetical protein ACJ5H2_09335 [Nocardioides sp. R1-1]|uniref:hypothetical protein n=1 Tax=Nocardioides sp. R1-1 TaxID=3383502 RepID=UPI0038D043EC